MSGQLVALIIVVCGSRFIYKNQNFNFFFVQLYIKKKKMFLFYRYKAIEYRLINKKI